MNAYAPFCLRDDRRLGGVERLVLSSDDPMQVPPQILKCVAFIGYKSKADGELVFRGTAFFLAHRVEGEGPPIDAHYIVTASHCVDHAKKDGEGGLLYIRINRNDGKAANFETQSEDWVCNGDCKAAC